MTESVRAVVAAVLGAATAGALAVALGAVPVWAGDLGQDQALLERLVLAEADGQGPVGMALVARSVLNRTALIQSGAVTPGTYQARSGALGDVIRGSGQYQPLSDGRIDLPWSAAQRARAREAIDLARDSGALRGRLLQDGVAPAEAERLLDSTGFRTPDAFHDPSQAYAQQRYRGHVFNADRVSRGADVTGAFDRVFGSPAGQAAAARSDMPYTSPLFPGRGFASTQALLAEKNRLLEAAEAQGSTFENNRRFVYGGEAYGWARYRGLPTPVLWGSVAGTVPGAGAPRRAGGPPAGGPGGEALLASKAGDGGGASHAPSAGGGGVSDTPAAGGGAGGGASGASPGGDGRPAASGRGRVDYRGYRVSSSAVRAFLQRVADLTGRTVVVTSGDRDHVPTGGSRTSLHLAHRAADFYVEGQTLGQTFELLRSRRAALLAGGAFEVIWHQEHTSTGGPHLHAGDIADGGGADFKVEDRGVYRRVP